MLSWSQRNWFILALLLAVFLGWLIPDVGRSGGLLRTEVTTKVGVFVIFLIQGLLLRTEELLQGLKDWRLHAICHGCIFVLAPVLFALVLWPASALLGLPPELRMGFFYLSVLPTTLSSAMVLTLRAGGDVTAALFNGTLSNLLGVVLVPVAVTLYGAGQGGFDGEALLNSIGRIALLIVLPFFLGQVLRPMARGAIDPFKKKLSNACSVLIAFIVFAAFANSFHNKVWSTHEPILVVETVVLVCLLMGLLHGAVYAIGWRLLPAGAKGQSALLFCGAQKTLASGLPMAQSIFAGMSASLGLIVLPLLLYHPLQLILGGLLCDRIEKAKRLASSAAVSDAKVVSAPGK
ncbi:MAG: bile acid:sodium symporter family protein [Opitutales bacterium]